MGKMILITNSEEILKPKEVLKLYRRRNDVERLFFALKDILNNNRIRNHSDDAMYGKLFIMFIALIVYSKIDKVLRDKNLYGKYTFNELIHQLKRIRYIETDNGTTYLTEISKKEKEIFKAFGIDIPR